MAETQSKRWEYSGLWRQSDVEYLTDFSIFEITGRITSARVDGYYLINGSGIDIVGKFEVEGHLDESMVNLELRKKYNSELAREIMRNVTINAKLERDYFVGKWNGERMDDSRVSGGIFLVPKWQIQTAIDFGGFQGELLKSHLSLLKILNK